ISVLGGSRVQIGGPTGAFVVIVYRIIYQHGYNGLLIATLLAGIILIIIGLAKLGSVIKFIPHSVIVGFTAGIAVSIFSSQFNDLLGLGLRNLPGDFVEKMILIGSNVFKTNWHAVALCLGTIVIMLATEKITRYIPGSLVAIIISAALVKFFHIPVETIFSRFGEIPHHLPAPMLPTITNFKTIQSLLSPAFTIAILCAIESLLSAVVADGMISGKHRSNMELVAQGVANIASPLFGGIPATGAIARTATNIKSGGRTPIAGIIHALTLLLIMLFFGNLAGLIPLSCLSGILIIVAYNMSEWRSAISIIKSSLSNAAVFCTTFFLTLVVDLTVAIEIGLVLAILLFIREMNLYTNISLLKTADFDEDGSDVISSQPGKTIEDQLIPPNTIIYEINGPLFFGTAYKFKEALASIASPPKVIILRMRFVSIIDITGLHLLKETISKFSDTGTTFILTGVQQQVEKQLKRSGLINKIGANNIYKTFQQGLDHAIQMNPSS
ncbi:MAG: SulP family inorganic anion transporter, partial [bacterium]